MSKRLFKTMVAVLAIAAAAAGPVRAQSNPTKYTSAVAMSALQVGDTLAEGFSLTGEDANFIYLVANRHKHNENLSGSLENITLGWIQSIGANCVFSTLVYDEVFTTFAPVDENGQDGDAWVVTEVESIADFTNITIAGIRIPGPPITVRMAEGTEEAANWTLASGNASVPGNQVLENVMSGSQVTATYNGTTKKVKSVKAVKYVAPAATVATAPTATTGDIVAGSETALVNAGAAIGGTMMYAVTTTNAQPASTADFSASVPTAEGRTAGTYYVWFYAKADAEHSDSEIAGPVSVTVTSATITVTWNHNDITGSGYSFTKDGVTLTAGDIDFNEKNFMDGGTFTTTLGNFTKIEVTAGSVSMLSGTGWSGNSTKKTWTGNASSVSFSGDIMGMGGLMGNTTFVFTIE